MTEVVGQFTALDRAELVDVIQRRYKIDGAPLGLDDAERLIERLDTEADYLGAYVDD
jgi:hypothetical protein